MKTSLYQWHKNNGGVIVPFAGWELPLHYQKGAIEEHKVVRRSAGLFDISHMGQFSLSGKGASKLLTQLATSSVESIPVGTSSYTLICKEDGGILDDLFVYRLKKDEWLIVCNAANREKDFNWFKSHASDECTLIDKSDETGMIALQGPKAMSVVDGLFPGALAIERFGSQSFKHREKEILIGRTGYTGEDGVEFFTSLEHLPLLWEALFKCAHALNIEIEAIGLAARDSLRFEPGFALYGHEITEEISPIEAKLKWACNFDKPFIGREALNRQLEEGLERRLVSFKMEEKGVPREGYPLLSSDGETIGKVVSGLYAPHLGGYYGNGYVTGPFSKTGSEIVVDIRGRAKKATVEKRPLYRPTYR